MKQGKHLGLVILLRIKHLFAMVRMRLVIFLYRRDRVKVIYCIYSHDCSQPVILRERSPATEESQCSFKQLFAGDARLFGLTPSE